MAFKVVHSLLADSALTFTALSVKLSTNLSIWMFESVLASAVLQEFASGM